MMQSQCKIKAKKKPYPFSIAAILGQDSPSKQQQNGALEERSKEDEDRQPGQLNNQSNECKMINDEDTSNTSPIRFGWLDCTRYKPPKVPRSKRRRGVAARPSRQPRVPFTPFQQATLENKFQIDHYLTSNAVSELSVVLNLPEQRIKIWFQNRRARERREGQQKTEINAES